MRQFGTTAYERMRAAAPDASGGVYVSGSTYGSLGAPNAGLDDAWVAHFDGSGNRTWLRQFGTNEYDQVSAAARDASGGVYVGGHSGGVVSGASAGDFEVWIARYDDTGHQAWIRQFGSSAVDYLSALSTDGSTGVYVGGSTYGAFGGPNSGLFDVWTARYDGGLDATRYCHPAMPNSTGHPGVLTALGSNAAQANDVTLLTSNLPLHSFGFLLTSRAQGNTYPVGNSQGRLCLGGSIGRYVGPGQIKNSGATGAFSLTIDLTSTPQPLGHVAAQPGDTWRFQAWYRDANPAITSNLTDAVSVTFH